LKHGFWLQLTNLNVVADESGQIQIGHGKAVTDQDEDDRNQQALP
jgi:hypothetical protein